MRQLKFPIRQQRDGMAFPLRPCMGSVELHSGVITGQTAMRGSDKVITLVFRTWGNIAFPVVGKQAGCAFLVEPAQFRLAHRKYTADNQCAYALWMCLGIGKAESGAPGATEDQHLVGLQYLAAQPFHVIDQMPGGIVFEAGVRRRSAAATLIEQQHLVAGRVEQPTVRGRTTPARPAMQKYGGLTRRVAASFPIHAMAISGAQVAM